MIILHVCRWVDLYVVFFISNCEYFFSVMYIRMQIHAKKIFALNKSTKYWAT